MSKSSAKTAGIVKDTVSDKKSSSIVNSDKDKIQIDIKDKNEIDNSSKASIEE